MKKKFIIIRLISILATLSIVVGVILLIGENKKITISFDVDGGKPINSIIMKKGESINLPDAEKDNYIFGGWYLDNKIISNPTTFQKDSTLKAEWIKIQVSDPDLAEKYKNSNWIKISCSTGSNVHNNTAAIDVKCGHLNKGIIEQYKVIKIISTVYKESTQKIIGKSENYFENVELRYGYFGFMQTIRVDLSTEYVGNDFNVKVTGYGVRNENIPH